MPRLAIAQLAASPSVEENLAKALTAIDDASSSSADLILFPEVFLNPFFPKRRDFDASEYLVDIDDEIVQSMQAACKKAGLIAVPNIYLREGNKRFDASLIIDRDGSLIGTAKMVHIAQAPGFYEQDYYDPWETRFCVFDTDVGRAGIVICFDRHYPESIRSCVLQGADIILVPTVNMVGEPDELFEWEMRVSAFQNSVYIAMCNRVGEEEDVSYYGRSILVDPEGNLAHRSNSSESIDIVEYDLEFVATAREQNQYLKLLRVPLGYGR
ncbi:MAG: carbon-nitrogen hydrolase family protein [Gammaproteobacteria bacterium]|nr:carbon-nitrogen hydrolase family protein [Gammaproteobacteria bacterium]